ncbi:MAG: NADH-quinone oxidoreductase subunit H, partial [Blastocatellia bacterium]|nr:NADH-quinone oxidoreductase subunit H [Blastocatellia bacterium]
RTLSLQGVVEAQRDLNIWLILFQLPAFVMYLFAAVAETNRAPFDLAEAESELVGGFHTEYSGFRFSIYFIAEYANMVVVSAIAVALFLGGWYLPLGNGLAAWFEKRPDLFALLGVLVFAAKTAFVLYLFFWLRWTFPRYRFDQLMDIGWKWMIPSALLNIVLTAIIFTVGQELNLIRAKGDGLVITPLGYGYFIGMSVLSLIPIALLLQTINQNSRTFNLHAHRTTIRFSERYASPKEDVAPAAETKSESAQADSPTASETKKD